MKQFTCLFLAMMILACAFVAQAELVFSDGTPQTEEGETDLPLDLFTSSDTGTEQEAVEEPEPIVTPEPVEEGWPRKIVVTVGGDTTLGTTDGQRERSDGFDAVVREKGYDWPFSELAQVFANDDLTLINFEGTLTESNNKVEKLFNFKGPAEYAEMLVAGSVEAVTLANNHTGDYGDEGKADTQAALDQYGVTYCAQGQTAIYEVRGVKIGLIGNTFPYKDGKRDISADIKALREAGCAIVIPSFHWGSEYEKDFNRDQRNIGRAAVKAGADIVVGHHPHIIQGIEAYEDTYILYSLGNLVFGGNTDPDDRDTFIAQFTFTVNEDGSLAGKPEMKLIPVRLTAEAKGTDYRPVFPDESESARILKKILGRSSNMGDFVNPE